MSLDSVRPLTGKRLDEWHAAIADIMERRQRKPRNDLRDAIEALEFWKPSRPMPVCLRLVE